MPDLLDMCGPTLSEVKGEGLLPRFSCLVMLVGRSVRIPGVYPVIGVSGVVDQ